MPNHVAPSEQRRRFSRVLFAAAARLLVDDRDFPCQIQDLSLKGALLRFALPDSEIAGFVAGTPGALELRLGEDDVVIRMSGVIAHVEGSSIGLRCQSIDLDSVSHLRRLVELNVGDEAILRRELSALVSTP